MPLLAIAALAAGTYAFRLAGPVFRHRMRIPDRLQRLLSVATAVLLTGLVATAALTQGHGFAGWARPAGWLRSALLGVFDAAGFADDRHPDLAGVKQFILDLSGDAFGKGKRLVVGNFFGLHQDP